MNTDRMTDIVEFLRARLDEDERLALAVRARTWTYSSFIDRNGDTSSLDASIDIGERTFLADYGEEDLRPSELEHMARWDPARVLAEVEAKRRIINRAEEWLKTADWVTGDSHSLRLLRDHYTLTIRGLAQPYADHPDYDPAWRP